MTGPELDPVWTWIAIIVAVCALPLVFLLSEILPALMQQKKSKEQLDAEHAERQARLKTRLDHLQKERDK